MPLSDEDYDKIKETSLAEKLQMIAAELGTIQTLLISKGICTLEEYNRVRMIVTQQFEQDQAEFMNRYRQEHPGYALMEKLLGGNE